jgi:RimJ/RimL family protein N-acetyltransferase
MYTVFDFDPFTADDALWEAFKTIADEPAGLPQFKLSVRQECSRRQARYVLVLDDQTKGGIALYGYQKPDREGGHILHLAFSQRSIGQVSAELQSSVLNALETFTRWSDTTAFVTLTNDPVVMDILARYQSTPINVINYYQLSKFDFDRHRSVIASSDRPVHDPGLTLEFHEYVPEPYYGLFADLMTTSMNDILRSDEREVFGETAEGLEKKMTQFRGSGIIMLAGLMFDPARVLVALSFVLVHPDSTVAKQELTGVSKAYRGKNLGTYLKARITEEAFRRYPQIDRLETNCYSVNLPIIHINLALGYILMESRSQLLVAL